MRLRLACTALALGAIATQIRAADVDCAALSNAEQVSEVIARIARTDEAAMRQFMQGATCLDDPSRLAAGRAAGEFFDQKPREYLQLIATGEADDVSWLEALNFAPERLNPDPVARIAVFARRAETLQANSDLIAPAKYRHIRRKFQSRIEHLASNLARAFPDPLVMTDPLAGIEFDSGSVIIEPASPDWVPITKYAQGSDWWVFGSAQGAGSDLYLLISGFSFRFSTDRTEIEGIDADEGWVERVDIRDNRIEVLAPASEFFTSPRIPREVAAALCKDFVYRLSHVLKDGRLQRALDERLRREPDAGLAKPLRDAFIEAKFDVKGYREIPNREIPPTP